MAVLWFVLYRVSESEFESNLDICFIVGSVSSSIIRCHPFPIGPDTTIPPCDPHPPGFKIRVELDWRLQDSRFLIWIVGLNCAISSGAQKLRLLSPFAEDRRRRDGGRERERRRRLGGRGDNTAGVGGGGGGDIASLLPSAGGLYLRAQEQRQVHLLSLSRQCPIAKVPISFPLLDSYAFFGKFFRFLGFFAFS